MNFNIDSYKEKYKDIVLQDSVSFQFIPTCSMKLNAMLSGGLPAGKIVELYGHEGSGKSTLMLSTVACLSYKANEFACIIDTEGGISSREYLKSLKINLSKVMIISTSIGEQVFQVVNDLVANKLCKLIVVDSVATIITEEELEYNDMSLGSHARFMSKNIKKTIGVMNQVKSNACLVLINQMRSKIGDTWKGEMSTTTTGGKALKYYSSLRLEIERSEFINFVDSRIGFYSKVKISKSRFCAPFTHCIIPFLYKFGFSTHFELLEEAMHRGKIAKSGSWLHIQHISSETDGKQNITDKKYSFRSKAEAVMSMMQDDELVKIVKNMCIS